MVRADRVNINICCEKSDMSPVWRVYPLENKERRNKGENSFVQRNRENTSPKEKRGSRICMTNSNKFMNRSIAFNS